MGATLRDHGVAQSSGSGRETPDPYRKAHERGPEVSTSSEGSGSPAGSKAGLQRGVLRVSPPDGELTARASQELT